MKLAMLCRDDALLDEVDDVVFNIAVHEDDDVASSLPVHEVGDALQR